MPTVDIYNIAKEKVGELDLKDEIFVVEVKGHLLHEVVTWQRACRRRAQPAPRPGAKSGAAGANPGARKAPAGPGRAAAGLLFGRRRHHLRPQTPEQCLRAFRNRCGAWP